MKTVKTLNWLMALVGLWVALSPFILGFSDMGAALWNDVIVGVIITALTVLAARGEALLRDISLDLVTSLLGFWLLVSPSGLGFSETEAALQSNGLAGVVILVLGIWSVEKLNGLYAQSV
jgi:hypothetical protein